MKVKINKKALLEEAKDGAVSGKVVGGAALGGGALAAKTGIAGKLLGGKVLAGLAAKGSGVYVNPDNDTRAKSMMYSGLGSVAATGGINLIGSAFGSGVPVGAIGVTAGMAGLKGAALGGIMHKSRDTLLNRAVIPAAVVAGTAPLTNMALDAAGYPNIGVDASVSALATGGLGAGLWYYRNQNKKKELY